MLPNARLRPVAETRVHAHPVAEGARQIAPRAARAGDPQHCFAKQPVVIAAPAGIVRLAKTKRLHLRPLGVSQNESVHSKLESQSSPDENPESKQTLGASLRRLPASGDWADRHDAPDCLFDNI